MYSIIYNFQFINFLFVVFTKPIFIILQATLDMLTILINETKILFLRARNPPPDAHTTLVMMVAPGFSETSKTIAFLKSKMNAYFADHRTRLNSEARLYGEDYIKNNR